MLTSSKSDLPMTSTAGAIAANIVTTIHHQRITARDRWSDSKISTTTAIGSKIRSMGTSGIRVSSRDGPPITTVIGPGSIRGDGRGLTTRHGDTLRSTTDV